jgi:hypothetical protein
MNRAHYDLNMVGDEGRKRRVGVAYHALFGLGVAEMQRLYYLGYVEAKRLADDAAERMRKILEASRCIRHWHDTSYNPETGETEGMIVSAAAVRTLWEAQSALDEEVWPNKQIDHP